MYGPLQLEDTADDFAGCVITSNNMANCWQSQKDGAYKPGDKANYVRDAYNGSNPRR